MGLPAQQRAALTLGHTPPHTELHPVVERVRQALGPHRASRAHRFGPVLGRTLDEKLIRICRPARGLRAPVGYPAAHAGAVLSRIEAPPRRQTAYSPSPVEDVTEGRRGATALSGPILHGPNGLCVPGRSPNGVSDDKPDSWDKRRQFARRRGQVPRHMPNFRQFSSLTRVTTGDRAAPDDRALSVTE